MAMMLPRVFFKNIKHDQCHKSFFLVFTEVQLKKQAWPIEKNRLRVNKLAVYCGQYEACKLDKQHASIL